MKTKERHENIVTHDSRVRMCCFRRDEKEEDDLVGAPYPNKMDEEKRKDEEGLE